MLANVQHQKGKQIPQSSTKFSRIDENAGILSILLRSKFLEQFLLEFLIHRFILVYKGKIVLIFAVHFIEPKIF